MKKTQQERPLTRSPPDGVKEVTDILPFKRGPLLFADIGWLGSLRCASLSPGPRTLNPTYRTPHGRRLFPPGTKAFALLAPRGKCGQPTLQIGTHPRKQGLAVYMIASSADL